MASPTSEFDSPIFPVMKAFGKVAGITRALFTNSNELKPVEAAKESARTLGATAAGAPFDLLELASATGGGIVAAANPRAPGLDFFDEDPGVFSRFGRGFTDQMTRFEESVPGLANVRAAESEGLSRAMEAGVPMGFLMAAMMGVPGPEDTSRVARAATRGPDVLDRVAVDALSPKTRRRPLAVGGAEKEAVEALAPVSMGEAQRLNGRSLELARELSEEGYAASVDAARAMTPRKVTGTKGRVAAGVQIEDNYARNPASAVLDAPAKDVAESGLQKFVLGRDADAGAPKLAPQRFENADGQVVYMGPMNVDEADYEDFILSWLDDDEILDFAYWYEEAAAINRAFVSDPDAAQRFGMGILAGQKNTSPEMAHKQWLDVLMEQIGEPYRFAGAPGRVRVAKAGGLADPELSGLSRGARLTSGSQKLRDFFDSMLGSPTRGVYLNDPRSGAPFVIDVHMKRLFGDSDAAALKKLVRNGALTEEQAKAIRASDGFRDTNAVGELQYEWMSHEGRRVTDRWNEIGFLGKEDWKPHQVQAALWRGWLRAMGDPEPFPRDLLRLGDARLVDRTVNQPVAEAAARRQIASARDAQRFTSEFSDSPGSNLDQIFERIRRAVFDQQTNEVKSVKLRVSEDPELAGRTHTALTGGSTDLVGEVGEDGRFVRGFVGDDGKFYSERRMDHVIDASLGNKRSLAKARPVMPRTKRSLTELFVSPNVGTDMQLPELFDAYRGATKADKQLLQKGRMAALESGVDAASNAIIGRTTRLPNRAFKVGDATKKPSRLLNSRPIGHGLGIWGGDAEPSMVVMLPNASLEEVRAYAALLGSKFNQKAVGAFTPGAGEHRHYMLSFPAEDVDEAQQIAEDLQSLGVEGLTIDMQNGLVHVIDDSGAYDEVLDGMPFELGSWEEIGVGWEETRAAARSEYENILSQFDLKNGYSHGTTRKIFDAEFDRAQREAGRVGQVARTREAAVAGGSAGAREPAGLHEQTLRTFQEAAARGQDPLQAVARGGF